MKRCGTERGAPGDRKPEKEGEPMGCLAAATDKASFSLPSFPSDNNPHSDAAWCRRPQAQRRKGGPPGTISHDQDDLGSISAGPALAPTEPHCSWRAQEGLGCGVPRASWGRPRHCAYRRRPVGCKGSTRSAPRCQCRTCHACMMPARPASSVIDQGPAPVSPTAAGDRQPPMRSLWEDLLYTYVHHDACTCVRV